MASKRQDPNPAEPKSPDSWGHGEVLIESHGGDGIKEETRLRGPEDTCVF